MDIDWSKAPEEADRYYPEDFEMGWSESWGNGNKVWARLCWFDPIHFGGLHKKRLNSCIMRPINSDQQWGGEGFPPVGAYIEWLSGQYGWLGGRVVGHDGAVTVVSHNDGYTGCHPHEVRPLRTPEQIASEEREKAIDVMVATSPLLDKAWSRLVCANLYDAGYRKQEND